MDGTHLHLLVNHLPILGAFGAVVLLLVSLGYGRAVLERTALALLVVVGIAAGAAKFSGEPAEDTVRGLPGVTRDAIEEHAELGDNAFIAAALLGVLSVAALIRWRQTPLPRAAAYGALGGALLLSGTMAYVGLLGGQIRHTEVRPGATKADALKVEAPRNNASAEKEQ
jgi:hypothetical protein